MKLKDYELACQCNKNLQGTIYNSLDEVLHSTLSLGGGFQRQVQCHNYTSWYIKFELDSEAYWSSAFGETKPMTMGEEGQVAPSLVGLVGEARDTWENGLRTQECTDNDSLDRSTPLKGSLVQDVILQEEDVFWRFLLQCGETGKQNKSLDRVLSGSTLSLPAEGQHQTKERIV